MRCSVGQDKRNSFARRNRELGYGLRILATERGWRTQHNLVRPSDGTQRPIFQAVYPRHDGAVAEPQGELHPHGDAPALTNYQADQPGMTGTRRHKVDQHDRSFGRLKPGLQNERVRPIAPGCACRRVPWGKEPPPVLCHTKQAGEAGVGVEAWPAQPVDRAVPAYKGRRLAIADQGVVFDEG